MILAAIFLIAPVMILADPQSVYEEQCTACPGLGVAGAPKIDDTENWIPRIAQGIEVLYKNAINGFSGQTGMMPAKGGFTELTDEEVRVLVDHMVAEITRK